MYYKRKGKLLQISSLVSLTVLRPENRRDTLQAMPTPIRTLRLTDEEHKEAMAKARSYGIEIFSDVVRKALRALPFNEAKEPVR